MTEMNTQKKSELMLRPICDTPRFGKHIAFLDGKNTSVLVIKLSFLVTNN